MKPFLMKLQYGVLTLGFLFVATNVAYGAHTAPLSLTRTTGDSDNTPTFTWSAPNDSSGTVASYEVRTDAEAYANIGNTTAYTYAYALSEGMHTFSVRAKDTQGSIGAVATISFTIDAVAPFSDSAAPVVGAVNPTSLNTNVMTAFSVSYSDNVGVAICSIYSDGVNQGTMTLSGGTGSTSGTASRNLTYQNAGISNLQVRCTDAAGNTGFGSSTAVTVSVGSGDTTAPSQPSSLTRTTPSSDNTPSFSWGVSSDNVAVTSYEVQLDGGSFMNIGNVLGYTATVLVQGSHTIAVRARDNAGNVSSAASLSFTISANASDEAATPTLPPPPSSSPGGPPFSLDRMRTDSDIVITGNLATLRTDLGVMECDFTENAGIANAIRVFGNTANESTRAQIAVFNACGTKSTRHLGSGERLGVVNSYRAAF